MNETTEAKFSIKPASRQGGHKCDCGKPASWRGSRNGWRTLLCQDCAEQEFVIQSEQIRGEPRRYYVVSKSRFKTGTEAGTLTPRLTSPGATKALADILAGDYWDRD